MSPPYLDKLFRRALSFAKGTNVQDSVTMERLAGLVRELRWVMSRRMAVDGAPELKACPHPFTIVEAK